MPATLVEKLIESHRVEGNGHPGEPVGIRIDQTLTQDATGTLVMLELEALGLDRVETELSVQYVDHNLIQQDFKNADDHLFLASACRRFGIWFSRPGNGVSHPLHQQRFGAPGKTLLGADSHTCAAGALGMLAIGTGGLDVALAMAGRPFFFRRPRMFGVELVGRLSPGVSAKDLILEMLRRHGVRGAVGCAIEYHGSGVESLSCWDRHVVANMGAELGATASVFPADAETERFLTEEGRAADYRPLAADPGARYDLHERIDLSQLVPLIAKPQSPSNVVPVTEVAGEPIYQAYLGSSANPGFRDFAVAAQLVRGHHIDPGVSLDINPSTRRVLSELSATGLLGDLLDAGARIHQAGCNGCIGMGQAPASGKNSLRTVPRNFPGRSGTSEDSIWLCSPETAAASALNGLITDPRVFADVLRSVTAAPPHRRQVDDGFARPAPRSVARSVSLEKGPNIGSLPELGALPERLELQVLLTLDDDISTDEILPGGARVLPFRSNIARIAEFCFSGVDAAYVERARDAGRHAIVAGRNYGQGSSREHAALAPRHLGLSLVLAQSFARIHRQNLINFGIVPATFIDERERGRLRAGSTLRAERLREQIAGGQNLLLQTDDGALEVAVDLSPRERRLLLAGGILQEEAASRRRSPDGSGATQRSDAASQNFRMKSP